MDDFISYFLKFILTLIKVLMGYVQINPNNKLFQMCPKASFSVAKSAFRYKTIITSVVSQLVDSWSTKNWQILR
jgi:hypothetical protein